MRLIIFVLFILKSFSFAELYSSKVKYFFEDEMRFEFTENSKVLKDEANKMYNNLNDKIKKHKYWVEKYTVEVATGPSRMNENTYKYYRDLYKDTMGMEWAATEAKRLATYTPSKSVEKERNRAINIGEIVYSKTPSWSEIVSFYGGYAEINKSGLKKTDLNKFTVEGYLEKIEISSENKCQAVVKLRGKKDYAFRFYKIDDLEIKYNGEIAIPNFNKLNIDNIMAQTITFSFQSNQYMGSENFQFLVDKLYPFSSQINNYVNDVNSMFDDLLSYEDFNRTKSNEFEYYASLFRKNFLLSNQQSNDLVTYSSLGSIDNIELKKNTLNLLKEPKNNIDNSLAKIELINGANSKLEDRYKLGLSLFFLDIDEINSMVQSNMRMMEKEKKKEEEKKKRKEIKRSLQKTSETAGWIALFFIIRNNWSWYLEEVKI